MRFAQAFPRCLYLGAAGMAVWAGKLACLFLVMHKDWNGWFVPVVALVSSWSAVVLLQKSLVTTGSKKMRFCGNAGLVFLFTLVQSSIFLPDMYAAFAEENAESAWTFSVSSLLAGIVVLSVFRVPAFLWKWSAAARLCWVYAAEAVLFVFVPLCYWAAFPLPVLFSTDVSHNLKSDLSVRAADLPSGVTEIVLIDPQMSNVRRQNILTAGESELESFAHQIAMQWLQQSDGRTPEKLVLILPETALYLNSSQFQFFANKLQQSIQASREISAVFEIVGARYGTQNVVFYSGPHPVSDIVQHGIVAQKNLFVPIFEKSLFGNGTRADEVSTKLPYDEWLNSRQLGFLPRVLSLKNVLICYEALNVANWRWGQPLFILTNHSTFSLFRIASLIYDFNLRMLATLFKAPLVLGGNMGGNGVFLTNSDLELLKNGDGAVTGTKSAIEFYVMRMNRTDMP